MPEDLRLINVAYESNGDVSLYYQVDDRTKAKGPDASGDAVAGNDVAGAETNADDKKR